jgi:membrane associated rhomboid family serine protease
MSVLFYLANALVMPPVMFFSVNFYKFNGREIEFRRLWISIGIFSLTAAVTSLQFVFPEIIPALSRNGQAVLSGEVWRLITPLFIQPMGVWQCLFNGVFFIAFLPIAEHLYGRSLLLIYFGAGIVGQMANSYWATTPGGLTTSGGGSSTALYGVMGSLMMFILLNRKTFPKGYLLLPIASFFGAVVLVFFEDGHAPSLLAGGLLGLILRGSSRKIYYPSAGKIVDQN